MQIALVVRDQLLLVCSGRGNLGAVLQTMATRIAIFLLNIGASVITARTMGAEGRGLLAALLTWPQFIAYLMTFGLTASLLYNVRSTPGEKGRLFGAATVLGLLAGIAACLAGVALMPWMLPGYGADELAVARLLMVMAPAILLALVIQTAAEAIGDFPGANALRGISVFGTFAGVAMFAGASTLMPLNAALCYLLPQVPIGIWLFWRLRSQYAPTLRGFGQSARQLIDYGLRCYPVDLLNTALTYAAQALVITLLSPAEVGYFAVSLGVGRMLEVFHTTVATVLLPATAGRQKSEITEQTLRAARLTLLLMMALVLPLLLALPILMPAVYGADFASAASIARLLLLEGAISGTVWVMLQAFLALGRPELSAALQVVALALLVSLLLVVVPRYGAAGAAGVLLAVAIVKFALAMALYRVVLGASARRFLPDPADLQYVWDRLHR